MTGRSKICWGVLFLVLSGLPAAAEEDAAPRSPRAWLERAEDYARLIQVPDGRAATLVSIGTGYVDAGLPAVAQPLLKEAAAFGATCTGCFAKAQRLADLALLQSQAGDPMAAEMTFRLAQQAVSELEEDADRILALAYLGARRQDGGDAMLARPLFAEAFAAAKKLRGEDRYPVLADLALTLVTAEEDTLAAAALGLVGSREEGETARLAQIEFWIHRKEYEAAERVLGLGGVGSRLRLEGLCGLALAYGADGNPERARMHLTEAGRLARSYAAGEGRAEALLHVARTAHELGVEDQAESALLEAVGTVSARENPVLVVAGLLDCARTAHRIGKTASLRQMFTQIPRLADAIEDPAARDDLRLRVVEAAIDVRDFAAAERAASKIEDAALKEQAHVTLAEGYGADENCSLALASARKVRKAAAGWDEEETRANLGLLRRIAVVLAGCGEADAAAEIVAGIGKLSPFQAALACTYIAREIR